MHATIPADPFEVHIPDREIADLKQRLSRVRLPNEPEGNDTWDWGTNLTYMERLVQYWRDDFDWRAQEERLNRFPQYTARLTSEDEEDHIVHFIYERGSGDNPMPLILTHGWPSTYAEFLDVVERLAHPERFGGIEAYAFDVIVPSLIGFGFSSIPHVPIGPATMAQLWHQLMRDVLGYEKYAAQGGDWGSIVTSKLALDYPDDLIAIHLTMLPLRPHVRGEDSEPVSEAEGEWIKDMKRWWRREEGYREVQGTKPMSLAYGLHDSPAGLAGWLADKWYRLGDTEKSHPFEGMEGRFSFDQILTIFSIYWFTGTINAANSLYKAGPREWAPALNQGERVSVPTGYTEYAIDVLPPTPRSWGERSYNIKNWQYMNQGGHFAALEEPELFVDDLRAFFAGFR